MGGWQAGARPQPWSVPPNLAARTGGQRDLRDGGSNWEVTRLGEVASEGGPRMLHRSAQGVPIWPPARPVPRAGRRWEYQDSHLTHPKVGRCRPGRVGRDQVPVLTGAGVVVRGLAPGGRW